MSARSVSASIGHGGLPRPDLRVVRAFTPVVLDDRHDAVVEAVPNGVHSGYLRDDCDPVERLAVDAVDPTTVACLIRCAQACGYLVGVHAADDVEGTKGVVYLLR